NSIWDIRSGETTSQSPVSLLPGHAVDGEGVRARDVTSLSHDLGFTSSAVRIDWPTRQFEKSWLASSARTPPRLPCSPAESVHFRSVDDPGSQVDAHKRSLNLGPQRQTNLRAGSVERHAVRRDAKLERSGGVDLGGLGLLATRLVFELEARRT